jgi:hypothetical protein
MALKLKGKEWQNGLLVRNLIFAFGGGAKK